MASIPDRAYDLALQRARTWLRRKNVVSIGLGQRKRAGAFTPQKCVIVTVDHKLVDSDRRRLRLRPIPPTIRVRMSGRAYAVPVDVQESGGMRIGICQGIVSTKVSVKNRHKGAVGAVVRIGALRFAMTAGHVVVSEGARATIDLAGQPLSLAAAIVRMGDGLDHALLGPSQALPPSANSLPAGQPITGVREPSLSLVNTLVFFCAAATGELHSVAVRAVKYTAEFSLPGTARFRFTNLIATDAKTIGGDSGTLLYDSSFRAIGTLVGLFANYSCFIPCGESFSRLGVNL